MEIAVYVITGAVFCVGLFIIYRTYLERKRASAMQNEIRWVLLHLDRALTQLNSPNDEEIVAGLQSLAVLNDQETRRKAVARVVELSHSANPRIAGEARFALARLYSTPNKTAASLAPEESVGIVKYG